MRLPRLLHVRNQIYFETVKYSITNMESGLAHLEVPENQDPLALLRDWIENYQKCNNVRTVLFNLATATKSGEVSNRNLVLRELTEDAFCFTSNGNSKKIAQISDNPKVAASFYFNYNKSGTNYSCQVLVQGVAEILPQEVSKILYESEPLFCKIRSHICQQGKEVKWNELKEKHDVLLDNVIKNKRELEMPEHHMSYKILPNYMDFYYAYDRHIADRVLFKKDEAGKWSFTHIAA